MTTPKKQDSSAIIQKKITKLEIFPGDKEKVNPSLNVNERKNSRGMKAPPTPPRSPETRLSSQSELQNAMKPKVAPAVPPKSHQTKFAGRQAIFEQNARNNALNQTDSSSNESIDKKFKYEVKQPGVIHTTARKNQVGNGLNELNAKKKAPPVPPKSQKVKERGAEILAKFSTQSTINDMLFGEMNDSTPCLKPQRSEAPKVKKQVRFELPEQTAESPISKKADSPDRFKPKHQSQQINQRDFTKPAEIYSNLVRCSNTRSGETLEHNVERKNEFKVDLSIKHIKGDIATCAITKGNNKKGVTQPDASHKQEPESKFSKVSVKELANRFRG